MRHAYLAHDLTCGRQNCLMAMDYAKRALALHTEVHGKDSPQLERNLDLYAAIYAEVGKLSYDSACPTARRDSHCAQRR